MFPTNKKKPKGNKFSDDDIIVPACDMGIAAIFLWIWETRLILSAYRDKEMGRTGVIDDYRWASETTSSVT